MHVYSMHQQDLDNGRYAVSYRLQVAGEYQLHVDLLSSLAPSEEEQGGCLAEGDAGGDDPLAAAAGVVPPAEDDEVVQVSSTQTTRSPPPVEAGPQQAATSTPAINGPPPSSIVEGLAPPPPMRAPGKGRLTGSPFAVQVHAADPCPKETLVCGPSRWMMGRP